MIVRFTDKLPKALYLDSSVILNATMTGGRFHTECASFLRRIRDEGIRCATASLSLEILTVDLDAMLDAKEFLWDYKLLPRDSVHLAVTLKHRFKAIATTNPDFRSVSDLVDVYTCNPKMFR